MPVISYLDSGTVVGKAVNSADRSLRKRVNGLADTTSLRLAVESKISAVLSPQAVVRDL